MQKTFRKLEQGRQEAILDAAAAVFAEMGYHGSNIPRICERAGISTGALYKYFRNKEALFRAVLDRGVDIIQGFYDAFVPGEIFASITEVLTRVIPFTREYRPYLILYIDIGGYSLNTFADYVSERFESVGRDFFFRLVEAAKGRGEIDAQIDSDHAAYLIDSFVILFSYALVSEHYRKRFDRFYGRKGDHFTEADRIGLIVEALRMFLARRA